MAPTTKTITLPLSSKQIEGESERILSAVEQRSR